MSFIFRQHLLSLNKRMDRGEFVDFGQGRKGVTDEAVRQAAALEGIDENEAVRRREQFRYTY